MRISTAKERIAASEPRGYSVSFDVQRDGGLFGDHFPDYHNGELFLESFAEARELAARFARARHPYPVVNVVIIEHGQGGSQRVPAFWLNRYPVASDWIDKS